MFETTNWHVVRRLARELVPSPPRQWLRRWVTDMTSGMAASSRLGWAWCRANTPPEARRGSAISPSEEIRTCAPCWSWARARCCSVLTARVILSRAGHSPCSSAAAITEPAWPSPPRTPESSGRCWPRNLPQRNGTEASGNLYRNQEAQTSTAHRAQQVRPALAEPDQLPSGNRCLTIEARARGLHAGRSAKHSQGAD